MLVIHSKNNLIILYFLTHYCCCCAPSLEAIIFSHRKNAGWDNTIPHSTSTLSKRSARIKRPPYPKDAYDKDYMKKRNLILELLAVEIEFMLIWANPLALPELQIPGEESVAEWRARPMKLNVWRDFTRLAWSYNPALAVFLPQRIRVRRRLARVRATSAC